MTILAWYKFNNEYLDASGNQYDGTNNGTAFVSSKRHYGAEFIDANDDSISLPLTFYADMLTSFSFTCWVKPTSFDATNGNYIISFYPLRMAIAISSTQYVTAYLSSTGSSWTNTIADTSTQLVADTWYHIGITYDGVNTTLKIYINGNEVKSDTSTVSALFSTAPTSVKIGDYEDVSDLYHFDGIIDYVKFDDTTLTDRQISYWKRYYEIYDVWINKKSFAPQIIDGFYTSAVGATGEIELTLNDRGDYVENYIDYEDDIMLFYKGDIVFRGKVDIIDNNDIKVLTVEGRDYTSIFFDRSAIGESYTNKTRGEIIIDLCSTYVSTARGNITFDTSNVDSVTSTLISPSYPNDKLASILFSFANEDNAVLFIEPTTTSILNLYYRLTGDGSLSTGLHFNADNGTLTTSGNSLRSYSFKRDSKEIKNIFTVYGPASSGIAVSIRDFPSIAAYGEKWADPVVDLNATTVALAKASALEIKNRYNQVLVRGDMITKDNGVLQQGKNLTLTASKLGYINDTITILEVMHTFSDKSSAMNVVNIVRSSAELMTDLLVSQTEQNLRDTDPANTSISEIVENILDIEFIFTVTIKESGSQAINARIGVMKIGIFEIGNSDASSTITLESDLTMILTNAGKQYFRNLVVNNGSPVHLDATNAHIALEGNTTPSYDETTTALTSEIGREVIDSAPDVATNYKATWASTFDDAEITGGAGTYIYGTGIFDASSSGNLVAVISHSAIQKVTGNDIVYEITMEVSSP